MPGVVIAALLMFTQAASGSGQASSSRTNLTTTGGHPDEVICRSSEPVLGSRVARRRICRTRAEWQAFAADREQLRRDIQNAAKGPSSE